MARKKTMKVYARDFQKTALGRVSYIILFICTITMLCCLGLGYLCSMEYLLVDTAFGMFFRDFFAIICDCFLVFTLCAFCFYEGGFISYFISESNK